MEKIRILIVGANSYIGISLENWLLKNPERYEIDTVGTLKREWQEISFERYHVIFHVAGIAHLSADTKMEALYYKINRDLAIAVANKSKSEGISQFIFMSSIIIYGKDGGIGERRVIAEDTEYAPVDFYGRSKLEADLAIQSMANEQFKTVIIRAPVVYGPGCKGNFPKLLKVSKYTPMFFNIKNERSMIYIDNLCEFLKIIIDNKYQGVFYPQNREYVSTTKIIRTASKIMNRNVFFTSIFNHLLKMMSLKIELINKVFGNKVFDKSLTSNFDYCVVEFEESIKKSISFKR